MSSRKSVVRFFYTLCVWMTVVIACLWTINGGSRRFTNNSFKEQTSAIGGYGVRRSSVHPDRSLSLRLTPARDNNVVGKRTTALDSLTDRQPETRTGGLNVTYDRFLSKHLSAVEDSSGEFAALVNESGPTIDVDYVEISDNQSTGSNRVYDSTGNPYLTPHERTDRKTTADIHRESRGGLIEAKNVTLRDSQDGRTENVHPNEHRDTIKLGRARRLPQALIIGVKKCGTRALLEYLRLHPDITAPGPEPHFFDRYYHLGLDWYRDKMPFSNEGQITIEKTPRYFVNTETPERVHRMSRDVKLIIVVRDPITRAISDFTQSASRQRYLGSMAFERKAFKCNGTGQVNSHWSGISTGVYVTHVKRWLRFFPFENMHFVSGENLIKRPAQELESIQGFLNLTRFINDKHFYFNETKGFPCLKKGATREHFQCFNSRKGRPHIHVQEDTIRRLRTFFEPYNRQFYQLTGMNFGW